MGWTTLISVDAQFEREIWVRPVRGLNLEFIMNKKKIQVLSLVTNEKWTLTRKKIVINGRLSKISLCNGGFTLEPNKLPKMLPNPTEADNFSDFSISYERVSVSANYLLERTKHRPKIAIICGSGLGASFFHSSLRGSVKNEVKLERYLFFF